MKVIMIGTVASSTYRFRMDLIKKLILNNFHVYVFVSEYDSESLAKIKNLGAEPIVYRLSRSGLNPFYDIFSIFQLVKYIENIQPDLVFSYFSKPVIYGTFAAKIVGVPKVIGMLEGLGYVFTEQPNGLTLKVRVIRYVQILLYKFAIPLLDKIIFLNHDDPKDLLEKYYIKAKKIEVLGGIGLDLNDYPYTSINLDKPIRFLFIGRLLKEKGINEFISAAEIVKNDHPNAIFTVLGAIDYMNPGALSQEELNNYIRKGIIEYAGHVLDVQDWIMKSHVFVLPSYYREGIPRSTQEAMAIGRPVITTDVPGCRETVIDGINGFLVPKWNTEILAKKMIFLINHPNKIKEMGQHSRKIAEEKFDSQKVNQRVLQILSE